jgi:predicted RNA binding protein YcfA (HicA-like mRNA interferase family)
MRTSDLTFAALRSLLLDLGFVENTVPGSHFLFEHASSGTVLVFRSYRPQEKVNLPDLVSVRIHLDQRDLLAADAFDNLLRKASA